MRYAYVNYAGLMSGGYYIKEMRVIASVRESAYGYAIALY
jgi:hypothetical protein